MQLKYFHHSPVKKVLPISAYNSYHYTASKGNTINFLVELADTTWELGSLELGGGASQVLMVVELKHVTCFLTEPG